MSSSRLPSHRIAVICAAVALALPLSACSSSSDGATVKGAKLIKSGQITTCTHLPYAPFQSEKDGKVVGFDVSMIDLVAEDLGVKQVVVDKSFETIKTGADLNASVCDVAAAGMTITDERKQNLDFSVPYFDATQALLARKGVKAATVEDITKQKLKLGSQSSTTGEDFAHSHGADPQSFESSDAELNGLRTGQVDVIVQDYPVVQNWLKDPANSAKFEIVGNLDTGEQYGFAVRKDGNPKLLAAINQAIKDAKSDGTYKKLYEQWIGPMPKGADAQ
ncbi:MULTISPECIES: ABC transporter substrate-binding protein [unclassified Streptomyces]|uniref:ABC transporter substrate-binding protein n=1 Tax=unclassified Streptomyces TaxID=2593676 RepID=UPI002DD87243|nr:MULTISPECIES: ABC transporter substrate-binding protein [unclassified Streptomyces]WSF83410.1 ABC transporter substrate-binding protein [Streptomyces sp. NBC_01744]WSC48471.1 ABC transporter substrate-binding protein [Streptomyces sp. NBC_01762]WSC52562.1 ABC transporter substrate-binding protein [Streptomyces sp. NBC_01761]WSD28123.1 ABC transporter substrate-binding protein [Streptomyces sp. NBC_01751]WSJ49877.1 ABC transporter substrate-binding protein [Streptomyces sp. NBC_01318]